MTQRAKLYTEVSNETIGRPELLEANWYAVQTRSRHEKRVARYLAETGIDSFLPLVSQMHHWSDRRKVVDVPLFAGYLFINVVWNSSVNLRVLNTSGVARVVTLGGHAVPVSNKEIGAIRTLLSKRVEFGPHPFITSGQRVRIRGGALDGVEGIFLERNSDFSLVVSVEMIQRSVVVRINGYDVEII